MSDHYYYTFDGKRAGPVSFPDLRELATKGELKRTDKLWCKGMKKWQAADSVPEIFDELPPDLEPEAPFDGSPPFPVDGSTGLSQETNPSVTKPTMEDSAEGLCSIVGILAGGIAGAVLELQCIGGKPMPLVYAIVFGAAGGAWVARMLYRGVRASKSPMPHEGSQFHGPDGPNER